MKNIVVSVIIPTKNSSATLGRCLESIRNQTYKHLEIIVVDNFSTDSTPEIAKKYTELFFSKGPERSAQVNYGVTMASGKYIYKVDSDFIIEKTVIEESVKLIEAGADAVIVHNSPDESISWIAKLRKFEVDMYKYNIDHSSARFVKKDLYIKIGGFNSAVTAGEDYDFQNKLNRANAKIAFADAEALHLGEPRSFWRHLVKYYDYGKDFINYSKTASIAEKNTQLGFFRKVYIKNWKKFLRHPLIGIAFLSYHCLKYFFGGLGLMVARLKRT